MKARIKLRYRITHIHMHNSIDAVCKRISARTGILRHSLTWARNFCDYQKICVARPPRTEHTTVVRNCMQTIREINEQLQQQQQQQKLCLIAAEHTTKGASHSPKHAAKSINGLCKSKITCTVCVRIFNSLSTFAHNLNILHARNEIERGTGKWANKKRSVNQNSKANGCLIYLK